MPLPSGVGFYPSVNQSLRKRFVSENFAGKSTGTLPIRRGAR